MKRSMPCYEGASELTHTLRRGKHGAELWICTSRPYLKLDSIDPDTRHWLLRNRIQYDNMIYGDRKYYDLVHQVEKSRIVAVVDDLPEMCMQAMHLGLPTIMIRRPHNEQAQNLDGVEIAHNLLEVQHMIRGMLDGKTKG
jgi:hypothetical protein